MNRYLVIIPTYNCRNEIIKVLESIRAGKKRENINYWVIDNLSRDGTFEAARRFVTINKIPQVQTFQAYQNNNLGGTHKIGFTAAINDSFQYVAIFHGDNQGKLEDLEKIIDLSTLNEIKISYLGARFSKKSKLIGYSKSRIIGNLVLNLIYSMATRRKLIDLGSGLNLYNVEDLKKIEFLNFGDSLTFNYELILAMISKKILFDYVPIEWREDSQVSNAKNFTIFLEAIKILINWKVGKENKKLATTKIYKISDY
jgi:dolichol-phosphate mannosyltransferase